MPRSDPTYEKEAIKKNPSWELAWTISECINDNAPIGWGNYIPLAEMLLGNYTIKRKQEK